MSNEKLEGYENVKQSPTISIVTWVYNAEKHIQECAESVMNQSFKNFEWIILDNGSTDRTSDILEEYVQKDARIKLFKNKKNSLIYKTEINENYIKYVDTTQSEYWCALDGDDYLHLDFLKELYTVAKKYDADIAICGTEMFNDKNQQLRGNRIPPSFYVSDMKQLGSIFPLIYGCFRPLWGKLVKTNLSYKSRKAFVNNNIKMVNGADTMLNLYYLKLANSVVAVNRSLHYYRVREDSLYSSNIDRARYLDYKMIYIETKQLLESWNELSEMNLNFIGNVLYYSIVDCMDITTRANVPLEGKWEVIVSILSDKLVNEVITNTGLLPSFIQQIRKNLETVIASYKQ